MEESGEDPAFLVDTKGRCFLCLIKLEPESEESVLSLTPSSVNNPISELLCYLKINLGKVLDDEERLSHDGHSLVKMGKGAVKVALCEECASIHEDFVDLHRQLNLKNTEEFELEMGYCLKLIYGKLTNADKAGWSVEFKKSNPKEGFSHAMTLRKKLIKHCSFKLSNLLANFKVLAEREKPDESIVGQSHTKTERPDRKEAMEDDNDEDPEKDDNDSASDEDWEPLMDTDSTCDSSEDEGEAEFGIIVHEAGGGEDTEANSTNSLHSVNSFNTPRNTGKPGSILNPQTGNYECSVCGSGFKTSQACKNHFESIHLQIKYQCTLCQKEFRQRASYLRHHQSIHMGTVFKCNVCQKVFTQKWYFKQHFKSDHLGRRLQCKFCSESFAHSASLNRHIRTRCLLRETSLKEEKPEQLSAPSPKQTSEFYLRSGRNSQNSRVINHREANRIKYCSKSFSPLESRNLHKKQKCHSRPEIRRGDH